MKPIPLKWSAADHQVVVDRRNETTKHIARFLPNRTPSAIAQYRRHHHLGPKCHYAQPIYRTSIIISKETEAKLRRTAHNLGITISRLIRLLLENACND